LPTSMTANPGLVMVEEEDADDDSDSERLWANSARMASAMALPSMTLPRVSATAAADGSAEGWEDDMANVVMMQVGDDEVDEFGLEG